MSDVTDSNPLPPALFRKLSAPENAPVSGKKLRVEGQSFPANDEVFWVKAIAIASATSGKTFKDLPKPVWDRMPWSPAASPFRSEPAQQNLGFSDVMSRASSSSSGVGEQQPLKAFPDFITRRLKVYQPLDTALMEPADIHICRQCGRSI